MLVLILMMFPTTVQSPVPTNRGPVTRIDEVNRADKGGLEAVSPSIAASVLTLPDPLQVKLALYHIMLLHDMKS